MKKIKKIKHRVAALAISFFLTLGLTAPAFNITVNAEALEVANSACTVADMIFSYCAAGGVAIMNETVIDDVYNVLGSSFGTLQTFVDNGLLTYSNGQYVDSGLSTNIASAIDNISSIDIGTLFAQNAVQNPAGVALTGSGSLAGIAGSVATTGVLPLTVGVAVSGYCGFQIGTIIANMLGLYGQNIGKAVPLDIDKVYLNQIANGNSCAIGYYEGEYYNYTYLIIGPGYSVCYTAGGAHYVGLADITGNLYNYKKVEARSDGNNNISYSNNVNQSFIGIPDGFYAGTNATNYFSSRKEFDNAASSWRNGTSTPKPNYSPDTVGINGNLYGQYDSNNNTYSVPDMVQNVDPETNSVNPTGLSLNDWKNYASSARGNYENGVPENNSQIFNYIINNIKIDSPTPAPNPDPDPDPDANPNPNPNPETVPLPDVNPYPDTYPVADPETVPENKPQPEYTEKATENETDIIEGDPYTTPNLLDKFPFCIPRDILKVFKKLDSGARQAPHIQWQFNPNNMIDYTFDIDFSTWDSVAALLRLLELAAFIIALGIATRNLILS